MNILDVMGVSKLSVNYQECFILKVVLSFKCPWWSRFKGREGYYILVKVYSDKYVVG